VIKNLQAVILAGGKGTRLLSLTKEIPKAMIDVNGKPFIEILINQLKKKGIKKFLILAGYKKKIISDYFKNKKNIEIFMGHTNWQTLTRIQKAKKQISNYFLLLYCDNYLINFKLNKQFKLFKKNKSNIVLSLVKKKVGQKGTVLIKNKKAIYKKGIMSDYTEAGYMLVNKKKIFKYISKMNKDEHDFSSLLEVCSQKKKMDYINYDNKYLCIENKFLLNQTKRYLKLN
jgi:mannose-1-phosphate guanylyltransferase